MVNEAVVIEGVSRTEARQSSYQSHHVYNQSHKDTEGSD